MPTELLNRLASSIPAMKAKTTKENGFGRTISLATEIKRFKFALALPVFSVDILPSFARGCPQCQKSYNLDFEVAGKRTGHEAPALLPCNCVIGFHCARQWLSPYELGFTCCPLCDEEFPDMSEEPDVDSPTTMDLSRMKRESITGMSVPAQEGLVRQFAQGTNTTTHISQPASWSLPSINEVLQGGTGTPFEWEIVTAPNQQDMSVTLPQSTPRGLAVAAVKAADFLRW